MKHDFCRNLCTSLRLLLFYICFCSLLINTRLVFISYFVSVPLRKGHRGLEYQCSFVRLYLLLFAFLIICIKTFCIFDYSYWLFDFWFLVDFCNIGDRVKRIGSVFIYVSIYVNIYLLHVDSSDVTKMIKQINKQEVVGIPFLRTVLLLKNQQKV